MLIYPPGGGPRRPRPAPRPKANMSPDQNIESPSIKHCPCPGAIRR
nr:MAG TPA: hypothetical protein [Caudoviricetes sp.]